MFDIINNKSNSIYNKMLESYLVHILGKNHPILQDNKLRTYYEVNIRTDIESISNRLKAYNYKDLEGKIKAFIGMLDEISGDIENIIMTMT